MVEPCIRIIPKPSDDGDGIGLVIQINESARTTLMQHLGALGPEDHHFHLEPYLTANRASDVQWADVVLAEELAP